MYLKTDLQTFDLKELNSKFDVILVEPPLEEYQRTMGVTNMQFWGWDQVLLLCMESKEFYLVHSKHMTVIILASFVTWKLFITNPIILFSFLTEVENIAWNDTTLD